MTVKAKLGPQIFAACVASVGQFLCGMSSGYTSPALPDMRPQLHLTSLQESLISGLMPMGAVVGGLLIPTVVDRWGRRACFGFGAVSGFIGWLTVAYARSAAAVMAGRLVQGFSCSSSFSVLPNYIGEVSEPGVRGFLGIFIQLSYCTGILTEYVVGKYVRWHWLALMSACVAAAWLPAVALLPESPLFLVMQRRPHAAAAALRRLRGPDYDITEEMAETERYAADMLSKKVHLRELLQPQYLRPLLITMGLFFFQPASGDDAVTYFTVDILKAAHSDLDPYTVAILSSLTWIPASLVGAYVADRLGRRPLLLGSQLLCGACLLALGTYFHLDAVGDDVSRVGWLPLTCVILFNLAFAVGLGLMPWIILGEMFSPEMRGVCSSIAVSLTCSITTLVTFFFDLLVAGVGEAGTFWLFGGVTACGGLFTLFCVYETRGKTLEQISNHYKHGGTLEVEAASTDLTRGSTGSPDQTEWSTRL